MVSVTKRIIYTYKGRIRLGCISHSFTVRSVLTAVTLEIRAYRFCECTYVLATRSEVPKRKLAKKQFWLATIIYHSHAQIRITSLKPIIVSYECVSS